MVVRNIKSILIVVVIIFGYLIVWKLNLNHRNISYDYSSVEADLSANESVAVKIKKIFNPPTELKSTKNFEDQALLFNISVDTFIEIKSTGEGADYSINPSLFKSYDNDGVELYFDMRNEKFPIFDVHGDDRQYRFLLSSNLIDGQNIDTTGVHVTKINPSKNSYIMEISIPWKSLGFIIPKKNVSIGFDAAVLDNDGGSLKALYNWNSSSEDSWRNTSLYGNLTLWDKNIITNIDSNRASSIRIKRKLSSSSKRLDKLWGSTIAYKFRHVSIGFVTDSNDLSGTFKSLWDNNNLYVLFEVKDNIKSYAKAMFDYGWIEDSSKRTIWQMEMDKSQYAGGALKNRYIDTTIFIKKGIYTLRYITDESHSPSQWDDLPPNDLFYGIKITYQSHIQLSWSP